MTLVSLYPDQSELVEQTRAAMRRNKSVIVQAATGFGKTRLALHMIQAAVAKGNAVGFMVPRKKLLDQTSKTLDAFGIDHGFVAAGRRPSPFAQVHMIMSDTLARRMDTAPKLKILFDDEAHYGGAEKLKVIRHYQAQGTWVVGLTATPQRPNGDGMGDVYDEMVEGPPVGWLIENDRLSEYRLFAPDTPDLSAIKTSNGDYVQKQIDGYMMADDHGKVLVGNAAEHYKKMAFGKLNLSFCTSVKAAEMSSQMFNDRGIPSAVLHGKMDDADIHRVIMAFARREILNISSCALLTFGFDLSQASGLDVTVESMSDLAPSKSLPWQLQKWGRVLRMKEEPAMLFDHVGNYLHHGSPDDDREWTLDAKPKRGGNSEPTRPTRACPMCYMVHPPKPICPRCDFVYPIESRIIEEVEGELSEVTDANRPPKKSQVIGQIARSEGRAGLQKYAKDNGYKSGWVEHQLRVRKAK
jgi:DNA repair protein RadD